jgi:hypothetical protein
MKMSLIYIINMMQMNARRQITKNNKRECKKNKQTLNPIQIKLHLLQGSKLWKKMNNHPAYDNAAQKRKHT